MVTNRKVSGKAYSLPAGLAYGTVISLGITLVSAAVIGKLVDMEKMSWENVGYGVMVLLLAASFLGAVAAYGKIKRQRLPVCLLSGLLYYGTLLLITALFFGGQFEAVGVTAALVLAGSGTAGLIGMRESRGGKKRKIRPGYR